MILMGGELPTGAVPDSQRSKGYSRGEPSASLPPALENGAMPQEPMMNLIDAAAYVGIQPRTLRKLIDRSRSRIKGVPVGGPTIQFFQASRGGAILFRQAWLDAYIDAGTHRPDTAPILSGARKRAHAVDTVLTWDDF